MIKRKKLLFAFFLGASLSVQARMRAVPAYDFLQSIGACVHVQHGQNPEMIAPLLRYVGIRNVRDAADRNYDMSGLLYLHRQAGVRVVIGPGSGVVEQDLDKTIEMAVKLHQDGALLAIEGPNEPNNFGGLTYEGVSGGQERTWMPVARFQRDLYARIKKHPQLKRYPVFGVSETGAETDNCGLQFLTIPHGAGTLMPDGTRYADYANVHNYMYHPSWGDVLHDNQVWDAANPGKECHADGLYGNHGKTWRKGFPGYTDDELEHLPRVTTETGVRVGDCRGAVTEEVQACNYLNLFLSQYKRGWTHTFIYEFVDDPDGAFGFYSVDGTVRRKSADYMHNFTTLLHDGKSLRRPKSLDYSFARPLPEAVHDLLLQKSDGHFWLVVWGELVEGAVEVDLRLPSIVRKVTVYDPTIGIEPMSTLVSKDVLTLTVSRSPLLLELEGK